MQSFFLRDLIPSDFSLLRLAIPHPFGEFVNIYFDEKTFAYRNMNNFTPSRGRQINNMASARFGRSPKRGPQTRRIRRPKLNIFRIKFMRRGHIYWGGVSMDGTRIQYMSILSPWGPSASYVSNRRSVGADILDYIRRLEIYFCLTDITPFPPRRNEIYQVPVMTSHINLTAIKFLPKLYVPTIITDRTNPIAW